MTSNLIFIFYFDAKMSPYFLLWRQITKFSRHIFISISKYDFYFLFSRQNVAIYFIMTSNNKLWHHTFIYKSKYNFYSHFDIKIFLYILIRTSNIKISTSIFHLISQIFGSIFIYDVNNRVFKRHDVILISSTSKYWFNFSLWRQKSCFWRHK